MLPNAGGIPRCRKTAKRIGLNLNCGACKEDCVPK